MGPGPKRVNGRHRYIQGQQQKANSDQSTCDPLGILAMSHIGVGAKSPEQNSGRRGLKNRVESEADQSYAAGEQPGDESNRSFKTVLRQGEVFQASPARNQSVAVGDTQLTIE